MILLCTLLAMLIYLIYLKLILSSLLFRRILRWLIPKMKSNKNCEITICYKLLKTNIIQLCYTESFYTWYWGCLPNAYKIHDTLVAVVSCPANMNVFTSSRISSSVRTLPSFDNSNNKSNKAWRLWDFSLKFVSFLSFHSAFLSAIICNQKNNINFNSL